MKLLVLDDERSGIQHLHDAFHEFHDVTVVRKISDALTALAEPNSSFDIIICGVHLMNESMFDFLLKVKVDADSKHIPFVCFRAGDAQSPGGFDSQLEETSRILGASAYIAIKDISDPAGLRNSVEQLLRPILKKVSNG